MCPCSEPCTPQKKVAESSARFSNLHQPYASRLYITMYTHYCIRLQNSNARVHTGCSSVWGGTATTNPYTVNEKGFGPAWGRSLFEDNAEYGFGMAMGTKQRRMKLKLDVEKALGTCDLPKTLRSSFEGWLGCFDNYDKSAKFVDWIEKSLPKHVHEDPLLQEIYDCMDLLRPQSHWIIGGDGWAYDIGYGGLDHVLSRGENVNIMVSFVLSLLFSMPDLKILCRAM